MDGPVTQPSTSEPSLWNNTSRLALEKAEKLIGSRREKILQLLARREMTIFEVAQVFEVYEHTISGRFSELEREGRIEKTGQRRPHPHSNCPAEIYRLRAQPPAPIEELLGYPWQLKIGDIGIFNREEPIQFKDGTLDLPGIPYRSTGGLGLVYRVELLECGGCGKPLKLVERKEGNQTIKEFHCGTQGCMRTWRSMLVTTPNGQHLAALVSKSS